MLKNPEIKRYLIIDSGLIIVFFLIEYLYFKDTKTAFLILLLGLALLLHFVNFERKKYKKITELSNLINKILHGIDAIDISSCMEGELSILSSEIQKLTVKLREQNDNLINDKVEMSKSIYDISHQIRTPLTSIGIVTDLLSNEDLSYERRISLIRELKTSLKRIDWLIEALLKLSKIDSKTAKFEKKEISVDKLIKESLKPFEIQMELKGISLNYIPSEAYFRGDLKWSIEAIGNIIKNCVEHLNENGQISIDVEENSIYTEIVIKDSGSGFYREDIPHLFERFYRGKNASESSIGIGLALSRSIIVEQNGTIKADNILDKDTGEVKGASFTIKFYKMNV